jgi:2-iminobutanoate/2-iminopropanoate deaminase
MTVHESLTFETRRDFLRGAPLILAGAGVLGAQGVLSAVEAAPGRRVVPGSPAPYFSRAVVFDRLAFVSGVLGIKPDTRELASPDFEPQCRQVLENLKASVEAAGSAMSRVLKCTCFLTEASDFPAMNRVYAEFFPTDPPARSTVVVKELVRPGAKIEIDCVAALA